MKAFLTWVCLGILAVAFAVSAITMSHFEPTYAGEDAPVSVYELQQDPASYDDSRTDGAAGAIVQQNLEKTHALNDVTSIVFDFRGYDTMGESFVLITAVTGVVVLLGGKREKKEEAKDHAGE